MGDKTELAKRLNRCVGVERAKAGHTKGVVKAEIRAGRYNSITPEMLEQIADYPVTISQVGGEGINYYIVIE